MATTTPWATLLCKLQDVAAEPMPKTFYEQLLASQGTGGLVDYWQEISYGALDLTGSQVFGWLQLDDTFDQLKQLDRREKAIEGIKAALKANVDLSPFYGVIVVLNATDLDVAAGGFGPMAFTVDTTPYSLALLTLDASAWPQYNSAAHEMGHLYGFTHARSPLAPCADTFSPADCMEYGDTWDVMGAGKTFPHAVFGGAGPGLNAAHLETAGWFPAGRVRSVTTSELNLELKLVALGHPDTPGPLAARLDLIDGQGSPVIYTVEFRRSDRWDAGIGGDVVLVHRVPGDGYTYLDGVLGPGQSFLAADAGFGVRLIETDADANTATVVIANKRAVALEGELKTTSSTVVGTGVFQFHGTKHCPAEDYPYERRKQQQGGTFVATADFLDPATIEYEWRLDGNLLDSSLTSVELPVTSASALPPPSGDLTYGHVAQVAYTNFGDRIALHNRPDDGTYSVLLEVTAKDAGGVATDSILIEFAGDVLLFEESYYADMKRCAMRLRADLFKKRTKPKKIPKGGDPGPWREHKRHIAGAVADIVRVEPGLAGELQRMFGHIPGVRLRPGLRPRRSKPKKKHT